MSLSRIKKRKERLDYLQNEIRSELPSINNAFVDEEDTPHCENMIGAVSIPVGVAGPLFIRNFDTKKNYYVPLATTEGALVASVNRGCKAISLSGGAQVSVDRVGMTRGPVFFTGSLEKSTFLTNWLKTHTSQLSDLAESTSSHLTLLRYDTQALADHVFVRFYYNTDDAMGMNMVTIATQKIVSFIQEQTGVRCLSVAGNYDIDKKPSWLNMINNRGMKGWAEVIIPDEVLQKTLKTSASALHDVWLSKCMYGSIMSGSIGFNSHFANICAAFFAATGQDLAHVVEGSTGVVTTRVVEKQHLYMSVYMPAVLVGTVGGGTKLNTQKESLRIIGVQKSEELAEVLLGAVLAGELSLLSSLSQGSLASAHAKLGR